MLSLTTVGPWLQHGANLITSLPDMVDEPPGGRVQVSVYIIRTGSMHSARLAPSVAKSYAKEDMEDIMEVYIFVSAAELSLRIAAGESVGM